MRAWSARPAPGGLWLGPARPSSVREGAGAVRSELRAAAWRAWGWTGSGPGCGGGRPRRPLASPPAGSLGASEGGCLGSMGVCVSALQYGHFLFACCLGAEVPLLFSPLSWVRGLRARARHCSLLRSPPGRSSESGTWEGSEGRSKPTPVLGAPSYTTPPLLPLRRMPLLAAVHGFEVSKLIRGTFAGSFLTRFQFKVSLKQPLYLVFSLQEKSYAKKCHMLSATRTPT